eukprot:c5225_g1_i1.p1 GENE.c5225_g1_i1~~c5225_g1_i1.p1  ORF type:complete len:555 (+),score=78.84 c5225_g1_i1:3-1667(+)
MGFRNPILKVPSCTTKCQKMFARPPARVCTLGLSVRSQVSLFHTSRPQLAEDANSSGRGRGRGFTGRGQPNPTQAGPNPSTPPPSSAGRGGLGRGAQFAGRGGSFAGRGRGLAGAPPSVTFKTSSPPAQPSTPREAPTTSSEQVSAPRSPQAASGPPPRAPNPASFSRPSNFRSEGSIGRGAGEASRFRQEANGGRGAPVSRGPRPSTGPPGSRPDSSYVPRPYQGTGGGYRGAMGAPGYSQAPRKVATGPVVPEGRLEDKLFIEEEDMPDEDDEDLDIDDEEPIYDRFDPRTGLHTIYYGDTAEALEEQENDARTHPKAGKGWVLKKHEKLLQRHQRRVDTEALAEALVWDDWAFLDNISLDARQDQVYEPIEAEGFDYIPIDHPKWSALVYLQGKAAFTPRHGWAQKDDGIGPKPWASAVDGTEENPNMDIEDFLLTPGLELQDMPAKPQPIDFLGAYGTHQVYKHLKNMIDPDVPNLSLRETQIAEEVIQKLIPEAQRQGLSEHFVREYARVLSNNRHLTMPEKTYRLRQLCGWNAGDIEPKIARVKALLG